MVCLLTPAHTLEMEEEESRRVTGTWSRTIVFVTGKATTFLVRCTYAVSHRVVAAAAQEGRMKSHCQLRRRRRRGVPHGSPRQLLPGSAGTLPGKKKRSYRTRAFFLFLFANERGRHWFRDNGETWRVLLCWMIRDWLTRNEEEVAALRILPSPHFFSSVWLCCSAYALPTSTSRGGNERICLCLCACVCLRLFPYGFLFFELPFPPPCFSLLRCKEGSLIWAQVNTVVRLLLLLLLLLTCVFTFNTLFHLLFLYICAFFCSIAILPPPLCLLLRTAITFFVSVEHTRQYHGVCR